MSPSSSNSMVTSWRKGPPVGSSNRRLSGRSNSERSPYPIGAFIDEAEINESRPRCGWWWCHGVWRFDIRADAVNYAGEALWLTVWRVHPDECADLCP